MSEGPQRWLSDLYRASSREEPAASLDRAILAEARKASRFPASIPLGSWGAPLAAAAVVVVTVSLVIALRDDPGSGYVAEMTTLQAPQKPSVSREESVSDVLASKRTEPKTKLNQDQQYLRLSDTMRQVQGDDSKQNETIAKPEREASAASREEKSSKAVVSSPSINAELMERSASGPPSLPASPAPALEAREQASSPPASAPPAAAGALGKATPREDAIEQRRARSSAESDQAGAQAKPNVASNEVPRRLEAAVDERIGPHAWLERIIKLRDEGRHAQARESLAAFKKRYPDHPLPDALRSY